MAALEDQKAQPNGLCFLKSPALPVGVYFHEEKTVSPPGFWQPGGA